MRKIEAEYVLLRDEVLHEARPFLTEIEWNQLEDKKLYGFAAVYEYELIGFMLFRRKEQLLTMEKIYVLPSYRLLGVGTEMLGFLCILAEEQKLDLVFSFEAEGVQNPFYRFVASTGKFYVEREEGAVIELSPQDQQVLFEKYAGREMANESFFQQPIGAQNYFLDIMGQAYPEIADSIRMREESYQKDLCICIQSGDRIQAACFIKEQDDHRELKLLYSLPGNGKAVARLLIQVICALEKCDPLPLQVSPIDKTAMKLLQGMCSSYEQLSYIYTAYYVGTTR